MFRAKFKVMLLVMCLLTIAGYAQAAAVKKTGSKSPAKPGVNNNVPSKKTGLDLSKAYNSYLDRLRSKVYSVWDINEVTGRNHVELQVTVAKDGSASDLALKSTPSNPAAEEAASSAFNKAQPLESLPAGSPPARVTLTFDSTYDPHGDSTSNMSMNLKPLPEASIPHSESSGSSEPGASGSGANQ